MTPKPNSKRALYVRPKLEPSLGQQYRDCPGCTVEMDVAGPWPPRPGQRVDVFYRHDAGCPATDDVRVVAQPKVGRNAQCRCGSGRKWKHCCGRVT